MSELNGSPLSVGGKLEMMRVRATDPRPCPKCGKIYRNVVIYTFFNCLIFLISTVGLYEKYLSTRKEISMVEGQSCLRSLLKIKNVFMCLFIKSPQKGWCIKSSFFNCLNLHLIILSYIVTSSVITVQKCPSIKFRK